MPELGHICSGVRTRKWNYARLVRNFSSANSFQFRYENMIYSTCRLENPESRNNPNQPEQPGSAGTALLLRILSRALFLFALQQFTLVDYISGLLVYVLSRSRVFNFVVEDIDVYS